jgi:uncharacterized membrane protein
MMAVLTHAMATTEISAVAFLGGVFALFGLLGVAMRDVKRNGLVGVRTPWTLADDTVWAETHRVTAKLWLAAGTVGIVLLLVGAPFWMPFVALLGAIVYPILHSYLAAKRLARSRGA